jgi:hypothetical protein
MPRAAQRKNVATFVGGLNTEASALTYPENAAKALDNLDLDRDGSLRRRRGLDYEILYSLSVTDVPAAILDTAAITSYEWESVDGDDSLNFLAVQIGRFLHFHDLGSDSLSTSYLGYIDLTPISISTTAAHEAPLSMASGKGKLFVVSTGISPAYISYDPDTNDFTGVKLTLRVRDMDGLVEDEDAPPVFGEDITPPSNPIDPDDNIYDVPDVDIVIDFEEWFPNGVPNFNGYFPGA